MIHKILHNKYVSKVALVDVRLGKNSEFFIWKFVSDSKQEYVGFSKSKIYFGNKSYLWYSLLIGYFLPDSYNINFRNAIGKECYVLVDQKGIVRSLVPFNKTKEMVTKTDEKPEVTNTDNKEGGKDNGVSEETELFN